MVSGSILVQNTVNADTEVQGLPVRFSLTSLGTSHKSRFIRGVSRMWHVPVIVYRLKTAVARRILVFPALVQSMCHCLLDHRSKFGQLGSSLVKSMKTIRRQLFRTRPSIVQQY